ncbi:uncharacterized protein LOC121005363 [Bufo bufo]|uniref:uncharacterized protein LOC121005363 n=1 Tax=Bufo bufo TaxID=8384 RepID=UPI001ABEAB58|nr:uncharacterized protein LOC121005363 [Bufo bufo]
MPSCIVKGCAHYTGMKANHPLLTMHVFPRELSRIKLWLQQIGQNFGDLDSFASKVFDASRTGKYRICSAHFAPGSYTSQGSRIVLKNDAIPTLFPGTFPHPPPDSAAKTDSTDTSAPKAVAQKEAGPQPKADTHKRLQQGVRWNPNARLGRTPGPPKEPLLDVNGRFSGVVRRDSKTKSNELRNNWTITIPPDTTEENRRALWSLENLLVSLLQHLAHAPLTSRPQKHKTSRLLNQTAEIVSVLTGEEWTVVKKNSHISKFYNMIREVPIKCGDVAVFFSMDEWDYIEDHEEHYKHVMVEEPKNPIVIVDDPKTEFFPETQYEHRPSFADLDFGSPLDFLPSPATFPPPLTDKEEREEIEVLEMSCVSEDVIDEPAAATPQRERIDSSSGDKDVGGRLDVARSPASPPAQKEKQKEKRKDDIDETLEVTCCTDDDDDMPEPPKRRDASPKRRDASPKRRDASPKRRDASPKRRDASPKRRDASPAADAVEESESASSELWIAQDGTTSSTWIPQDDPRPKGRNSFKYGKHAGRIQCPVSLSGITICLPEQPLKRAESARDPRCDLCDLSFPDKYELDLHQITHSKKQRL